MKADLSADVQDIQQVSAGRGEHADTGIFIDILRSFHKDDKGGHAQELNGDIPDRDVQIILQKGIDPVGSDRGQHDRYAQDQDDLGIPFQFFPEQHEQAQYDVGNDCHQDIDRIDLGYKGFELFRIIPVGLAFADRVGGDSERCKQQEIADDGIGKLICAEPVRAQSVGGV